MEERLHMNHPAVGSRLTQHHCTFTVWAPLRKNVELVQEEGKKTHAMVKDDFGYWTVSVADIKPGTEYYFKLDGDKTLPDPASRAQLKGVHGPSAVIPDSYEWTDHAWRGLPLGEMVIYELHVGTFTAARTFEGVITKLPYLKELGVNAIELMPVAQFPGERNWGYDGVYPFAVQDSYGGVTGLKKLVNKAHNAGIAVILDVVYNHQGPEGNYLGEYGPYFTDKYKTGWGQALNYDDAWCDGVRNFYWQNALMWLDEFRIDGLRLDAVHAIWDFSARHFMEELSAKVKALSQSSGRLKVLIAEFDLNNPRYILHQSKGGYGLQGQWIDEFHHGLHSLITGEVDGYYEDFGKTEHLAKSFKDSYVYTGQYSIHRKKYFGKEPKDTTFDQFVVFAQNHDQTGNRMLGDRLTALVSFEALKLAAATYLLSPHVPMLFMGEEYGEKKPFQYFISHTDKKLVELVRKGRKEEFSYFKWQGEIPDPQSEKTFQDCMLSWEIGWKKEAQILFAFYKHLIAFRKTRPAMQGKTRDTLNLILSDNGLICFERNHQNDYLLILLNFNKGQQTYSLKSGDNLRKVFDSASASWGGPAPDGTPDVSPDQTIDVQPQSVLIFEK
jgi:maltooligosyltrehalose trehalohydrolase